MHACCVRVLCAWGGAIYVARHVPRDGAMYVARHVGCSAMCVAAVCVRWRDVCGPPRAAWWRDLCGPSRGLQVCMKPRETYLVGQVPQAGGMFSPC